MTSIGQYLWLKKGISKNVCMHLLGSSSASMWSLWLLEVCSSPRNVQTSKGGSVHLHKLRDHCLSCSHLFLGQCSYKLSCSVNGMFKDIHVREGFVWICLVACLAFKLYRCTPRQILRVCLENITTKDEFMCSIMLKRVRYVFAYYSDYHKIFGYRMV